MEKEKNVFGMLDEISSKQDDVLAAVGSVQQNITSSEERLAELERKVNNLQAKPVSQKQRNADNSLKVFARRARKSWRWFGNSREFDKSKRLGILFCSLNIVFGLLALIFTTKSCHLFTTFTAFEIFNWVVAIYLLIMLLKAPMKFEVNSFASSCPFSCKFDETGMAFPDKEKLFIKIARWVGVIFAITNIVYIWMNKSDLSVVATIIELLFIGSIILNWIFSINFYAQYTICWLDGRNLTTNEPVTIVRLTRYSQFMLEKDFRQQFSYLLS